MLIISSLFTYFKRKNRCPNRTRKDCKHVVVKVNTQIKHGQYETRKGYDKMQIVLICLIKYVVMI